MRASTIFHVLVLSTFYFLGAVYALKCFQCNSLDNPECMTLKSNDTNSEYYRECPQREGNVTFCRKLYQKLENEEETERVRRSCGWILHKEAIDHCWRADTDFKKERNCQCFGDGCNSSSRIEYHLGAGLIAALAFVLNL